MSNKKLQRSLEVLARDRATQPPRERRFGIRDIMKKHASERVPRTEKTSYPERTGGVPEGSTRQIQYGAPATAVVCCRCEKLLHDRRVISAVSIERLQFWASSAASPVHRRETCDATIPQRLAKKPLWSRCRDPGWR